MREPGNRGVVFFDVTLLALRAPFKTPTGVARVELAYAFELLKRYPDRVRFIVALRRMVLVLPNAVVRRYLEATDLAWQGLQSQQSLSTIKNLVDFLSVPPAIFANCMRILPKQRSKIFRAANILLHTALRNFLPRGLAKFSKSDSQSVYIHVSGSNLPSVWIERWLKRSPSVSSLYLLHDIIPLTHPEYVRHHVPKRHARYVKRVLRVADIVVANSSFTASGFNSFAEENGARVCSAVVAPLGVSPAFRRSPAFPANLPPYFVFVSTIEPRKNHLMILQVWSRLVQNFGVDAPKLVLVGRRGWENENILDILERAHASGNHILECSGLSDTALTALIRNARASLMPSHVEGFGLPVSESLSLGTPVICSDLAPFREIAGDVPEYIDPLAGRGWAKVIMQYADEFGPERLAQLERIKNYQPPSWEAHFNRVCQVIDKLQTARPTIESSSFEHDVHLTRVTSAAAE